MTELIMIAAMSRQRVIGDGVRMLWHIPEDLQHFKETTKGHIVIMGRKTFESVGSKPLPGRINVVVSRQYVVMPSLRHDPDTETAILKYGGLEKALEECLELAERSSKNVFIIGGGEIYEQCMPYADKIILSRVEIDIEEGVKFPEIDESKFRCIDTNYIERAETPFTILTYDRIPE